MSRVLAGIHDPEGSRGEDRLALLSKGLHRAGKATFEEHGPLAVGFGEPARQGGTADGAHRCLLDGDIYNLHEVAGSLDVLPDNPEAVLAAGLASRGESLLASLRGDFAIVSWDRHGGGVLACDHIGGRGLVFAWRGARLLFASEVCDLLPMLGGVPEPDHASVAHWIGVSGPPGDRTMFAGVRRLRPGHALHFGSQPAAQRPFWRPVYRETQMISRAHAAVELRKSLEQAVERRTGTPDDTAVLLSGGLDSSSVAALARRSLPADRAPRNAYSAVFPRHRSVDESELIEHLVADLGLTSVRIAVTEGSVLAGALEYIRHWRLPPPSPNLFFWLPLLRRAAADGTTTMLDGEGGDELFGFSGYLIADHLRAGRLLSALSVARRFPSGLGSHDLRRIRYRLRDYGVRRFVRPPSSVRRLRAALRGARADVPAWFTDDTAAAYVDTDERWAWLDSPGPLWAAWRAHTLTWSAGPVATYDHIRRRSALSGLQPRHPLTDVDVIELMLRLPPELSFDPALTRPLLREAVAGTMPDEVRLRSTKSFFDEVFQECLAGRDLPVARRLVTGADAELRRYVDIDAAAGELFAAAPPASGAARLTWAVQVWRLLTAECWLRAQADAAFCDRLLESGELTEPRYELLEPFRHRPFSTLTDP